MNLSAFIGDALNGGDGKPTPKQFNLYNPTSGGNTK
jgi:hypothetical protein